MKAIHVPKAMKEAYHYETNPASFSRGIELDILPRTKMVFVSGTASVDASGKSCHTNNFKNQARLAFSNVTKVLNKAGLTWKDVVKTTIYLKNIDTDYASFNCLRKDFYDSMGLNPYPASTCVGANLCREELLVEIEAIAIQ